MSGDVASVGLTDVQQQAGNVVQWLLSEWGKFLELDPRLEDIQHHAAEIAFNALQNGDVETSAIAKDLITKAGDLRQVHSRAVSLFDSLRDAIPSFQGLGAFPVIPLALCATVIALGGYVTYVVTRETALEKGLDAIHAGKMTPAQWQQTWASAVAAGGTGSSLSQLSGALKWIVGGVVAVMLYKTVKELA